MVHLVHNPLFSLVFRHGTGVRIPPAPLFVVLGNPGNLRKVPANRRLRASRLAGGPFLFLPISGRFVQLHVRIMVRAAFSTIAESGDPGEQFIGNDCRRES